MKSGIAIIFVGISMFISGLIMFYSIQISPNLDVILRTLKHTGTFVGLMGIGVTIAGILLYLINRGSSTMQENQDKMYE